MAHPEFPSPDRERLPPNTLPLELAQVLKESTYACVMDTTDRGTILVMKMPGTDIQSVRGPVPIQLRQELYNHPSTPVIRLVVTIYDQPASSLTMETFINIGDPAQRAVFAALANQSELLLLCYDEALTHQLTKIVRYHDQTNMEQILQTAERLLNAIPEERVDFDTAKAAVMAKTSL